MTLRTNPRQREKDLSRLPEGCRMHMEFSLGNIERLLAKASDLRPALKRSPTNLYSDARILKHPPLAARSSIGREAGTAHRRITSSTSLREPGIYLIGRVGCKRPAAATLSEGGALVSCFPFHPSNHRRKRAFCLLGFEPVWASIDGSSGRLAARTGVIPAPGHR